MGSIGIPGEIKAFITENLDSIGQLEVLLLIYSNPDKKWNAATISEEMRSSENSAQQHLDYLCSRGLIVKHDQMPNLYYWVQNDEQMKKTLDHLAQNYRTYQVAIISLIYNKPVDRIRSFANAFKIKKDD